MSAAIPCPSVKFFNTLLKAIPLGYQILSCFSLWSFDKADIALQTGSSQLCYSDILLRCEENICSWHRNYFSWVHLLYFGTELQWSLKWEGLLLSWDMFSSSWPVLFLTFHGLTGANSACRALAVMPAFAFVVFSLSKSLFPLFLLIHSWLILLFS